MNVVVDTSVWIDFLAGGSHVEFESALSEGRVTLPPIVIAELLSGARTPKEQAAMRDLLAGLPLHDAPRSHWLEVGALRRSLARKGLAVSIPDAHVARCAIELRAMLMSRDRVFAKIAKHCALTVF